MRLFFLGGANEVGASCILVEMASKRILLDCGMRMKGDALPDLQTIQQQGGIDAIILSHAHMDHSGSLPVIAREFPQARLYMTHPTQALIRVLLYDSLKIMEHEDEIPMFDAVHVESMLANTWPRGFGDGLPVFEDSDIELTFFPAGHILGAACVYLRSESDGSLFYSGDISVGAQRTIDGLSVPGNLRPDVCIVESTYGNRLHANRDVEQQRMIEMVNTTISEGGKMLIPAFAVGRAQEVILLLRSAMNRGQLPMMNLYVDGMVRAVCGVYHNFPNYLRRQLAERVWDKREVFYSDHVQAVNTPQDRRAILDSPDPCCIVASSGMLSGGASAWYAQQLAGDPKSCIAITGYQDEESPGRKLQETFQSTSQEERRWTINGANLPLLCRTETYGLSAHADKQEIKGLLSRLRPQRVFLVHGDRASIQSLEQDLQSDFRGRVTVPSNGAAYLIQTRPGQRRQAKLLPPSMKRMGTPAIEELKELQIHLKNHQAEGPWTAAELLCIWGATVVVPSSEQAMTDTLNASDSFTCDPRRLYLFQPADEQKAAEQQQSANMEVNAMLAHAKQVFPPETGCYKAGARLEQRVARLLFRFPAVAKKRYAEQMRAFEAETGWTIELNEHPDTSYLHPFLTQLMGDEIALVGKTAWHLNQGYVTVQCAAQPTDSDELCKRFRDETGFKLKLAIDGQSSPQESAPGLQQEFAPKVTQQEAMEMVKTVFDPTDITLYKVSIKTNGQGKFLEIQFITPAVGKRYQGWLNGLAEETGWPMIPSQNPRQQELMTLARAPFDKAGIPIAKGPSIMPGNKVRVKLSAPTDDINQICAGFEERTGFQLEVIH